jgi:hypothetical protein
MNLVAGGKAEILVLRHQLLVLSRKNLKAGSIARHRSLILNLPVVHSQNLNMNVLMVASVVPFQQEQHVPHGPPCDSRAINLPSLVHAVQDPPRLKQVISTVGSTKPAKP